MFAEDMGFSERRVGAASLVILFDDGIQSTCIFRRRKLSKDLGQMDLKKNCAPCNKVQANKTGHTSTIRVV